MWCCIEVTSLSTILHFLFRPLEGPRSILLVRIGVGLIFFTQGILKYIDPNMGVARFTRIGFPHPYLTAHFVGTFEVLCGLLLLLGLWTRLASIPLLIERLRLPVGMHQFPLARFSRLRVQPRHLLPSGMKITPYSHHAKAPSFPASLILKPKNTGSESSLRSYPVNPSSAWAGTLFGLLNTS
jgi:hypothetical protein